VRQNTRIRIGKGSLGVGYGSGKRTGLASRALSVLTHA